MTLNVVELRNFTGGLNLRADAFQLASNETSDLLNVEIDPRGGFFSRGGFQQVNTTAIAGTWAPQRMHKFETLDGSHYALLSTLTKAYASTGGDFTEIKIGASTSITVTSDYGPYFTDWGDEAYIATGRTSQACKWIGGNTSSVYATTLTASQAGQWQDNYASPTGTHMPRAKFVETHGDVMWVANLNEGSTAYPNRIRWSHTFKPESWAELDYIDIDAGGSQILGIVSIKGHLLVLKESGIYAIFGYSRETYQVVTVSENIGVANPNAFAKADNGVYFFDYPNGMFFYNGTTVKDVFSSLRPMITDKLLSEYAIPSIQVSWVNRRAWLSVPYDPAQSATKATVNYVYDPSIGADGAWTKLSTADGYGLVAGIDWSDASDTRFPIMAHPHVPYVVTVDNYDIAHDAITSSTAVSFVSYYVTRWFDGDSFASKKMWKRPEFVCRAPSADASLTIDYYKDFNSGTSKGTFPLALTSPSSGLSWRATTTEPDAYNGWNQSAWSQAGSASLVITGRNLGIANSVQLKVSGPSSVVWAVNSILFKFNPRPVRS